MSSPDLLGGRSFLLSLAALRFIGCKSEPSVATAVKGIGSFCLGEMKSSRLISPGRGQEKVSFSIEIKEFR